MTCSEIEAFLTDLSAVCDKHKMCLHWDSWGEEYEIDGWDVGDKYVVGDVDTVSIQEKP